MSAPMRFTRTVSVEPTPDGTMELRLKVPGQSGMSVLGDIKPAEANQIIDELQQALTDMGHTINGSRPDGMMGLVDQCAKGIADNLARRRIPPFDREPSVGMRGDHDDMAKRKQDHAKIDVLVRNHVARRASDGTLLHELYELTEHLMVYIGTMPDDDPQRGELGQYVTSLQDVHTDASTVLGRINRTCLYIETALNPEVEDE